MFKDKIEKGCIGIENGIIKDFSYGEGVELSGLTAYPGFIDIHIHGGGGFDTMDNDENAVDNIRKYKYAEGVTSFMPTAVTADISDMQRVCRNVRNAMADKSVMGLFIEGNYISSDYKGSHNERFIKEIDEYDFKFIDENKDVIKRVIIAPEKKNASRMADFLRQRNINVSIGHSGADMQECVKINSNTAVHIFNAMKGLSHKQESIAGYCLTNDDVYCEVICDFMHVNKTALRVLLKCKPLNRIILVTDCLRLGGIGSGDMMFGGVEVEVKNSRAVVKGTNTLAGSTLKMIDAVKNMISMGVNKIDAVNMASLNPSELLGFSDRGSIEAGKRVDIVFADDDMNIRAVMCGGKFVVNNL